MAVGDITLFAGDAIVNAANSSLLGGGGVDGAIHRAAGPALLDACRRLRESSLPSGLPAGGAAATAGGNLPVSGVIHAVGPVWRGGAHGESATLASAYANSLEIASKNDWRSVAFPAISTGVYGFPKDKAATVAFRTITDYLDTHPVPETVWLVFHTPDDADVFAGTVGPDSTESGTAR